MLWHFLWQYFKVVMYVVFFWLIFQVRLFLHISEDVSVRYCIGTEAKSALECADPKQVT